MSNTLSSSSIVPCLLWNDRELAISLGMNVKRVQELARRGVLPGFKVGRKWQFDPDALRAWVKRSGSIDKTTSSPSGISKDWATGDTPKPWSRCFSCTSPNGQPDSWGAQPI
jgi:excisionase family DNA binding protein